VTTPVSGSNPIDRERTEVERGIGDRPIRRHRPRSVLSTCARRRPSTRHRLDLRIALCRRSGRAAVLVNTIADESGNAPLSLVLNWPRLVK
jgi:hypothetical protein